MYYTYILLCNQKTFYVGMTDNLEERLNKHKQGYSLYTKKFSDIRLVHKEIYRTYREVERREQQLKKWSIAKKKALISRNKELLQRLSRSPKIGDKSRGG